MAIFMPKLYFDDSTKSTFTQKIDFKIIVLLARK